MKHGDKEIPVIYFRYRLNPVNIKYFLQEKSFINLIVQILAIVGGIFSVIGLVN
jgi:endoplasmic reticulum-Golgi intermediate compartment protein 1